MFLVCLSQKTEEQLPLQNKLHILENVNQCIPTSVLPSALSKKNAIIPNDQMNSKLHFHSSRKRISNLRTEILDELNTKEVTASQKVLNIYKKVNNCSLLHSAELGNGCIKITGNA